MIGVSLVRFVLKAAAVGWRQQYESIGVAFYKE